MLCQLDSGLSAELNNNAVRLFCLDDGFNILLGKRIEVKSVASIEVCGYSFRVIVADNSLVAQLLERPYAVNGAVVELDTLTDSDRTRTENNDLLLALVGSFDKLLCLILIVIC